MHTQEPNVENDQLYDPKAAGAYLGGNKAVAASTLAKYRVSGTGPRFIRLNGKAIRYRRADLDAWLDERVRSSTSQIAA